MKPATLLSAPDEADHVKGALIGAYLDECRAFDIKPDRLAEVASAADRYKRLPFKQALASFDRELGIF